MKAASTMRGFGWFVAIGGLVACVVLLGHGPSKHPAPPTVGAAHGMLPIDGVPLATSAVTSSADPAPDETAPPPRRRRGNFVNNTPRRRELGWAGLLEGPDDAEGTPAQQQA